MKKKKPAFARIAHGRFFQRIHFFWQQAFLEPALGQDAFFGHGHFAHLSSAFLSAAAHSVASLLFSAFFSPLAGHWAVTVTAIIKAAAIIIIVFIILSLPCLQFQHLAFMIFHIQECGQAASGSDSKNLTCKVKCTVEAEERCDDFHAACSSK